MAIVTQGFTAASRPAEGKFAPSLDENSVEVLLKLDVASPLNVQLLAFAKDLGLRDRELTSLAGVSRSTLARWKKEGDAERPPALDDLRVIAELLIRTGAMSPRSVGGWLRSRNVGLEMERPLDALSVGEFSHVLAAAESAAGARVPVRKISERLGTGRSLSEAAGPSTQD